MKVDLQWRPSNGEQSDNCQEGTSGQDAQTLERILDIEGMSAPGSAGPRQYNQGCLVRHPRHHSMASPEELTQGQSYMQ